LYKVGQTINAVTLHQDWLTTAAVSHCSIQLYWEHPSQIHLNLCVSQSASLLPPCYSECH
jgi:hypothetical protein